MFKSSSMYQTRPHVCLYNTCCMGYYCFQGLTDNSFEAIMSRCTHTYTHTHTHTHTTVPQCYTCKSYCAEGRGGARQLSHIYLLRALNHHLHHSMPCPVAFSEQTQLYMYSFFFLKGSTRTVHDMYICTFQKSPYQLRYWPKSS